MRFILVWVRRFEFFVLGLFRLFYIFQLNVFYDDSLPFCFWVDL